MALTETLQLDLRQALADVGKLDDALDRSARSFKANLASALDPLSGVRIENIDAREVTSALDTAVAAADLEPEITADAEPVTEAVDSAVADADTAVEVDGNADAVTSSIDDAVASADTNTEVTADASAVTSEIDAAVASADTVVSVDADTSAAEAQIADLGKKASEEGAGLSALEGATSRAGGAAALATGEFGGLHELLGESTGTIAATATGVGALAAVTGEFFHAAVESDTADRRFAQGLGDMANKVKQVSVGDLNEDLQTLALRTGNSDEALKLAAGRIGDLGRSAGADRSQIIEFTQSMLALSIRATTLNPTLGQAGDVADQMTAAFARGGRALVPYGIALSSAEINARALADTGKSSASELTIFEKAAAGAALATAQLGGHLKEDINEGAKSAEIRLKSLKEGIGELAERLGAPIIEPILTAFQDAQPIITEVATEFGKLAQIALPLLIDAIRAVRPGISVTFDLLNGLLPVLQLLVDLVDAIPTPVLSAVVAFLGFNKALGGVSSALSALAPNSALVGSFASLSPVIAGVGAVVVGLTSELAENSRRKEENAAASRTLGQALLDETKARADTLQSTTEQAIQGSNLTNVLSRQGITFEQLRNQLAAGGKAADGYIDKIVGTAAASGQSELENRKLGAVLSGLKDQFQGAAKSALDTAVANGTLTRSAVDQAVAHGRNKDGVSNYLDVLNQLLPQQAALITGHKDAANAADDQKNSDAELEDQIKKLTDAVETLADAQLGNERAALRLQQSTADLAKAHADYDKAVRESGAGSDAASEAQRRLTSAQIDQKDAALRAADAQVKIKEDTETANGATISAKEHNDNLRAAYQSIANTLEPGSPLRVFLEQYIEKLNTTPLQKNTVFTADTSQAVGAVDDLKARIDEIRSKDVTITATTAFHEASLDRAMAGGVFGPGDMFIAGDPGPNEELVVAGGTGARVFTHADTVSMLAEAMRVSRSDTPVSASSPASSTSIGPIIVNEVANDPRATADAVAFRLGRSARR